MSMVINSRTDVTLVSAENRETVMGERRPHQRVELLEGYTHSSWSFEQAERVIAQSAAFLVEHFGTVVRGVHPG